MFGAIFRFIVTWIPFLRRLFPDTAFEDHHKDEGTTDRLPRARVAIIGSGVGGGFAAYFLREFGPELDIHMWRKKGSKVGGRTAVVEFDGHVYESGASVIHTSNKYLVDLAKKFGLETKGNKDEKTVPIAIFNGKYFSFRTSFSKIWSILKTFWCYGISLIRMDMRVRSTLKKFISIYDLQAKGQAFVTVPDMLKAMGGEEMFELTQMSTKDYMLRKLGWPEKLVDELVTGALRMNYGQGGEVNAFTGFVALAGMEDGSLWSVLRGNKLLVEKALQSSGVVLHEEDVSTVTRVQRNGKVSYIIHAGEDADKKTGSSSYEFDVVIIASLLSGSGIQFENFPTAIYTDAVNVPFQRTTAEFVKGTINPAFFGLADLSKNFPQIVLTTDMKVCPFQFRSVAIQIPSEITSNEVEDYQKPLSEQPSRVWKIFAPNPLSDEEKMQMFSEIENQLTVDWLAYPKYEPPEKFSPFILDDGVFYINTIEKAASAMEMCAIGAKNVALLTKNHLLENIDD